MRVTTLALGVALVCGAAVQAADVAPLSLSSAEIASIAAQRTVFLNGSHALDELRTSRPRHYATAQRVIAAAEQLCRPDLAQLSYVNDARNVHCAAMLTLTSNPPKRQIGFTVDDTRYVALVTIMDAQPRLLPAH